MIKSLLIPAIGRINTQNRDGSEIRFSSLAKIWQMKINLNIVAPPREVEVLKNDNVKAVFYPLNEKTAYEEENIFIIFLIYAKRLIQSLFTCPPPSDLIYVPSDFLIDLIPGIVWKRKLKCKMLVCLFLIAPNPFKSFSIPTVRSIGYFLSQRLSVCLCKKYADKILVLNKMDYDKLIKMGLLPNKIEIVSMGVDANLYGKYGKSIIEAPRRKGRGIFRPNSLNPSEAPIKSGRRRNKKYEACFIGRLHPQKGIFDLIPIWQKVCQKIPNAKLVIVAGGSMDIKNKLINAINRNGLSKNIVYLGFKTGDEKLKILKESRLFLMPSSYESWGMVAVEAMAAGLPVISYDLPVYEEIFAKGMIKVKLKDTSAFAFEIINLLNNEKSYLKMSIDAKSQAIKYDWQLVAKRELKIIEDVYEYQQ